MHQNLTPNIDSSSEPFWNGCREGQLLAQRCQACARFHYPPAPTCSQCGSRQVEWETLSGRGHIYSFAIYHRAFHPDLESEVPYAVGIVELPEGLKMPARILTDDLESLEIGREVVVTFQVRGDVTVPVFRLTS